MESISALFGVADVASTVRSALRWQTTTRRNNEKTKRRKANNTQLRGLETVHVSSEPPDIDICFVHGLTGDATSTWTAHDKTTKEDVFWPTAFLANQITLPDGKPFPRARIMLYGYETDVSSICWLAERTLYHHASHLLNDLTKARQTCSDRPLLFIVHSLGGLLVKSALVFSFFASREDFEDTGSPSLHGEIYLSTVGVVSFGTPQTFAKNKPLTDLVDHLCRIPHFLGPKAPVKTPEFEDFGRQSWKEDVRELQKRLSQYHPLAKEIPELFCFESGRPFDQDKEPISTRAMTVPPNKARYVHDLSDIMSVKRNHVELGQFARCDDDYWKVCDSIGKFYHRSDVILSTRRRRCSKDPDPNIITSGKIRNSGFKVKSELPPKSEYVGRKRRESGGEDYLKLIHDGLIRDRYAVLTGQKGSGKSTFALEYAHRQKEDPNSPFSSIFWLNAKSELSLESGFMEIAHELRAHFALEEPETKEGATLDTKAINDLHHIAVDQDHNPIREEDRKLTIRAVLNWLSYPGNRKWLLIYDDVEHPDAPYLRAFIPSIRTLEADRGYIIITSNHEQHSEESGEDSGLVHISKFRQRSWDQPRYFGPGTPSEDAKTTPSAEVRQYFSKPIRVGSFNRNESVELIEKMYEKGATPTEVNKQITRKQFAEIANRLKDIPHDIAHAGAFISSSQSPERVHQMLELSNENQFVEVPQKHSEWFDTCVMLGPSPIPSLLVELSFHMNHQEVIDGLNELQAKGLVWINGDDEFEVRGNRRRQRRQQIGGIQTETKHAERACTSLAKTVEHLSTSQELLPLKDKLEQTLLKHVDTCLSHYSAHKRVARGWSCEWDVLAELCEKHGLFSEAKILYRAAYGQDFANADTASQLSQSYPNPQSEDDMFFDSWHQPERSRPVSLRDASSQEEDTKPLYHINKPVDTKSSRKLRSELGLIRMQLSLGQFDDAEDESEYFDSQPVAPDERCQTIMEKVEDRQEERYLGLKIEALKQLIRVNVLKEDWPIAIESGHKLIDLLEGTFGASSIDTTEAIQQLAEIHMNNADYTGAEPLLEQVLMTYEQTFGNFHSRTVAVLELLARTYKEQGELKKARDSYRMLVDANRERLGEDHIETGKAKENLAIVYYLMKDYRSATDMYKGAVHAAMSLGEKSAEYERMSRDRKMLLERMRAESSTPAESV